MTNQRDKTMKRRVLKKRDKMAGRRISKGDSDYHEILVYDYKPVGTHIAYTAKPKLEGAIGFPYRLVLWLRVHGYE
jgi:hypothetical protein